MRSMTDAHAEAPPTWFRLSEESWAEIRNAYRNGATARELAARWKVSPTTIYRYACAGGWTKKRDSDAVARAHAAEIAAEERADLETLRPSGGGSGGGGGAPRHKALATEIPAEPWAGAETLDPGTLWKKALADSARSAAAGRLAEAQALAKLAESYQRMAGRAEPDLDLILNVLLDVEHEWRLFECDPDDPHPHPAKLRWITERFDKVSGRLASTLVDRHGGGPARRAPG